MPTEKKFNPSFSCPIPIEQYPNILLAHGGGGKLSHQLIEQVFLPAFANPALQSRHDGALLPPASGPLAFTTDSYVVHPLFFPGGDIGSLAVNGTVNDLAMCGARARYLTAGFILEEGLPMETLRRVVRSMQSAAKEAGVELVAGDTKVVERGKGDGIFINTAGIGTVESSQPIAPARVRPGDAVLLSGDIGRHGIAIMATREGFEFETALESDCAALSGIVLDLLSEKYEIHCLRDLTRGGLASALVEIAEAAYLHVEIEETAVPVLENVRGACEILGFDPIYLANEGRFIVFLPAEEAERALGRMRAHPLGRDACRVGTVAAGNPGLVTMRSGIGTARIVDMISGEQLPRIC
jgi:hydrogenase expression/formation protein HypE